VAPAYRCRGSLVDDMVRRRLVTGSTYCGQAFVAPAMVAFITFQPLVLAGQGEQRAVVVERLPKRGGHCGQRPWNGPHQES
jgi:hypothetical protein